MTNVIAFQPPSRTLPFDARIAALLGSFSKYRRHPDDVFWLKENAELLNILECTGQQVAPEALMAHLPFYETAEDRLRFFPQYYRFLLSMVLDLEDLGLSGDRAARMIDFADRQGLAQAELSDLQRAEARRLMIRRGVDPLRDPGLDDRLRDFAQKSGTFALPNKKAAYELTHIVFYLSEYGRRDPKLGVEMMQSLHFAGLTAYLDQNADLLAEICIALAYAGQTPPDIWGAWLEEETGGFMVTEGDNGPVDDVYHEYLVCNWFEAVCDRPVFCKAGPMGRMQFERAPRRTALREISQVMLSMDTARSSDWMVMQRRMAPHLSAQTRDVLETAAQSSDRFESYFEGFARAGSP